MRASILKVLGCWIETMIATKSRVFAIPIFCRSFSRLFAILGAFFAASAGAQSSAPDPGQQGLDATQTQPAGRIWEKVLAAAQGEGINRGERRSKRRGRRTPLGGGAPDVQVPPEVRVLRDLEYANVDGQSLRLDLYLPEQIDKDNPVPLLIWVHGGGWTRGDKRKINPLFVNLVPDGYAAASINYRLVGVARHPQQLHDVERAIHWLREQADRFGYDANRIGLGGASAGGHLALLAGLTGDQKELAGNTGGEAEKPPRISAIVDMSGPSDLTAFAASKPSFAGRKSPELLREASPVTYVGAGDPPILILHGDEDSKVPVEQSLILHERYKAAGLDSNLHVLEGAGHGGMAFKNSRARELVKEFLDLHLRPQRLSMSEPPQDAQPSEPMRESLPKKTLGEAHNQIPPRMHGLHWMVGPKSGLGGSDEDFKRLLAEVDRNLSENSCISGVFVIQHWDLLEPKPGEFRFERLDRLLALIRKHDRYYKLAITPGIYSPDWLYTEGAKAFETIGSNEDRRDIYQKKVRIPVPWDTTYQQRYYELLKEVASRYGADPAFRAITVTAATFMSNEWHLPHSAQDRKRWNELAGFPERLEQVWIDGINRFSQLFPKQILVLHASSYPVGLKNLGDSVVKYGATRFPGRFAVQINQLIGRFDQKQRPTYQKLLDYRHRYGESIAIGLQNLMGWSYPRAAEKQGSLEMTAYNFAQAKGEYLELWYDDGKTLSTCRALCNLLEMERGQGLAEFRKALEERKQYIADPGRRRKK